MEFRTRVEIGKPPFLVEPRERMLFVGSCFADSIGRRFQEEQFRAVVNPYGVMYNPASVLHTVERWVADRQQQGGGGWPRVVFMTLGTNHVYRLKETGEIVDNCQKRPARLFQEEQLSIEECCQYLQRAVCLLRQHRPDVHVVLTVSPIRYQKYGFHESQLSKAVLLLSANLLSVESLVLSDATDGKSHSTLNKSHSALNPQPLTLNPQHSTLSYFPAYEIMMDELRDYRFYKPDMLHPSEQAVEYIWQQLVEHYFSPAARQFLQEWKPIKDALAHRPFHPESAEYQQFLAATQQKAAELLSRYERNS